MEVQEAIESHASRTSTYLSSKKSCLGFHLDYMLHHVLTMIQRHQVWQSQTGIWMYLHVYNTAMVHKGAKKAKPLLTTRRTIRRHALSCEI